MVTLTEVRKMEVRCRSCDSVTDVPITDEQLKEWRKGKYIQDVAPELSPGLRELLISQTCEPCFDRMFKEDEDE
jgi:hypothetical protein